MAHGSCGCGVLERLKVNRDGRSFCLPIISFRMLHRYKFAFASFQMQPSVTGHCCVANGGHSGGHVRMVATFLPYLVCLITVRVLNKSRLTVIDGGGGDWSLSCGH